MSTKHSAGPGVSTQKTPRSAATRKVGRLTATKKKDRSPNLCIFTFADGRQCRTPRCSGHLHLCYFHAQKEAQSLAAQQVGQDISRFLPTKLLTACDLGVALSRLFCAVAQGQIKPKVASTLAYLAQTMLQSIPIAKHEYIESFDPDTWRSTVRSSFRHDDPDDADDPAAPPDDAADAPAPQPAPHSPASSASAPTAPQPSAQPAPSPHTPLPPTSAEFAQQLLAGLPTGSSPATPHVQPAPAPANPQSATTPAGCHSERSAPSAFRKNLRNEEPASSSNSSLATHHSSLSHNPPPVPPGFGAPANWDALIPPKPRRRFSRHWHLLE